MTTWSPIRPRNPLIDGLIAKLREAAHQDVPDHRPHEQENRTPLCVRATCVHCHGRRQPNAGRLRSPAATPGHWAGCTPPNKGLHCPADPPTVEEIILVMREARPGPYANRIRGLIAILWRAGLPISEALALTESDLDPKIG